MKITVRKVNIRGELRYRVNYREGGKRRRKIMDSKSAADKEAARLRMEQDQAGKVWSDLPAGERSKLIEAWSEAKAKGLNLTELMAQKPAAIEGRAVEDVITDLIAAKKAAGRAVGYVNVLEIVLNQFASGIEKLPIGAVPVSHIESFLDSKKLAYRSTLRSRISTLFKFAVRRGHCAVNPCEKLEAVTYHKPAPQVFTPEQLKAALEWLQSNPRGMTWFVLTALCGLRPEEAQKTERKNIHIKSGIIIVDSQTTKVRERRVVAPMKEAMAWLRFALKHGGETPITKQFKKRLIHRLRQHLGFESWPKDITRHTAASIWLARVKSAAEVAEQLGNSERVLKRDYKALVTPETLGRYLEALKR
jgi:integrase